MRGSPQLLTVLVRGLNNNTLAGKLWIVEKGRLRVYEEGGG
jgi:hypothetical protein